MSEIQFGMIRAEANFPCRITCTDSREEARSLYCFELHWERKNLPEKPVFTLSWEKPILDIQYQWHSECHFDRALKPDWGCDEESKLSKSSPLHCFFNDAGWNRYTVALDDCVTLLTRSIGVHEEDGTLHARFSIPLDASGLTDGYRVKLWIDETNCRYEDAIRAVAKWWEEKYPPVNVPPEARLPMYSSWYSFHHFLFADQIEAECARAVPFGMKTLILDNGWEDDDCERGYAYGGDLQTSVKKFPDMRQHVRKIHELGMKYMLWCAVPFAGLHSKAAQTFKGKTLEYIDAIQTYALDPRYPEVREYIVSHYVRMMRDWDLDGFKLDFIDSFRMTKETPAFREGMDYGVLEDAVHRLMTDLTRKLHELRPDVLIEFRQNYIGPVMRQYGNMFRVGDCPYSTSYNRVGIVDLRLTSGRTAVHSDMLMWNPEDRVENAACQIENVLFANVQLSARLDRIPEEHLRMMRFWTRLMQDEQHLLQEAPLYAEQPQMLYPVVRTEEKGRSVIACYQHGVLAEVPASRLDDVYLINANSGSTMLARFDQKARWKATVWNCLGEIQTEEEWEPEGLVEWKIPECGMVRLQKVR